MLFDLYQYNAQFISVVQHTHKTTTFFCVIVLPETTNIAIRKTKIEIVYLNNWNDKIGRETVCSITKVDR